MSAATGAWQAAGGLRDHLVASGLAGAVATRPRSTLRNCERLVAGHDEYTFGLSDWQTATLAETVAAVAALCGGDPAFADQEGRGWISPDATLAGIAHHRAHLAALAEGGGGRVLIATGHPTGLLPHYTAIARALQVTGSLLYAPLDDVRTAEDEAAHAGAHWSTRPRRVGVRFLDGVGVVFDGGSLLHTHRSRFMEAMLDALGGGPGTVDLVVADHGMAGAAIERGLPTLAIADVNDPALPLAQARGRTTGVLPIDDNLAPRLFVGVTDAVLDW